MNALSILKQDHHNVEALLQRLDELGDGHPAEKRAALDKVIEQLSAHAAVEEQVFYPAVRASVKEASDDILQALEEHHVVKWTLSELEKLAPSAERFEAKLAVLMESVRRHVEEEEEELFPKVREAFTVQELEELGDRVEEAKRAAPTRPHPRTPDTPPFNILIGAPAAVLDRALKVGRATVGKVLGRAR